MYKHITRKIHKKNLESTSNYNYVGKYIRLCYLKLVQKECNLRDLWNSVKHHNIQIIGVPKEEDKQKGHEKILEDIIVENFPKMGKEIATQVQETHRVPKRINSKQKTPRYILIKLTKIRHKSKY